MIVDKAESIVRPEALEVDSLLDDVRSTRQEAHRVLEQTKERERHAQAIEADLRYQLAKIEEARRAVIAETRQTMQNELAEIRREIENFRRQMERGGVVGGESVHDQFLAEAREILNQREGEVEGRVERDVATPQSPAERLAGPIEVGDRVFVPTLQASGEVLGIDLRGGEAKEADVQVGNFRLKLPMRRLELRSKAPKEQAPLAPIRVHMRTAPQASATGMQLDLRGERVESGLSQLDNYLDNAYLGNLPWVRIIHGKGTGAMRDAVRNILREHPLVSKYRAGDLGEGGDGVTVAHLVTDKSG